MNAEVSTYFETHFIRCAILFLDEIFVAGIEQHDNHVSKNTRCGRKVMSLIFVLPKFLVLQT